MYRNDSIAPFIPPDVTFTLASPFVYCSNVVYKIFVHLFMTSLSMASFD